MPYINRNTIQTKTIPELFELIKNIKSDNTKDIATDELIKRGYTRDDIDTMLN